MIFPARQRAATLLPLAALLLAGCAAGVRDFANLAPASSLSNVPHSAAEIDRLETFAGPDASGPERAAWREQFIGQRLNRAFAVAPGGIYGTSFGWKDAAEASRQAVVNCNTRARQAGKPADCRVYAINTEVVYPGLASLLPFRGVSIGPFAPSPEYFYRGPASAKGLLIWSHGTYGGVSGCGVESASSAAWSIVTRMNVDGWDIVRFDRDPCRDELATASRQLKAGVAQAATLGYRRIVLAGQSRGAIQSLLAIADPAVARNVSAVIAISPANSGDNVRASTLAPLRWRAVVDGYSGPITIATFFFAHDVFNPLAPESVAYARQKWATTAPNAHIYYNDTDDMVRQSDGAFNGHGGAGRPAFTAKYSACLATLIDTGRAQGACAQ